MAFSLMKMIKVPNDYLSLLTFVDLKRRLPRNLGVARHEDLKLMKIKMVVYDTDQTALTPCGEIRFGFIPEGFEAISITEEELLHRFRLAHEAMRAATFGADKEIDVEGRNL